LIQGTASLMTKKALVDTRRYLIDNKVDAYIVNMVHDEINVIIHESIAEQVASDVAKIMEQAGKIYCFTVPQIVKPIIKTYWAK
jgi:DNA polymerase I-like protein with 3'-5' exonuclease and polymerase domains